jgi:hypothetical protein
VKKLPLTVLCALTASLAASTSARAGDSPSIDECLKASDSAATLRGQKQFRAAASQFRVCAAFSCPADIQRECAKMRVDLNAQIPTVIFEILDAEGHRLLDPVSVKMDDEKIADALDGNPVFVDAGAHLFKFESRGKLLTVTRLFILQSDRGRIEKVSLPAPENAATATAPAPAPSTAASVVQAPPPTEAAAPAATLETTTPRAAEAASGPSRSTLGIAGLAAGGAIVVASGVLWKTSDDKYNSINASCHSAAGCSAADRSDAVSTVQTRDRLSVAGLVVGGALVAAGVAALLWPTSEASAPRMSLGADPSRRTIVFESHF